MDNSNILLQPGTQAPNFTLASAPDEKITLDSFRGQPVVLVFYPADWSPVCGDQISLYNEMLPIFGEYQAQLLGISVDNIWCHKAYSQAKNIGFPLLSDFHPKGEVAQKYGVYDSQKGESRRALYVIDKNGIIRWSFLSPIDENPGGDGILKALENLNQESNQ